jgi:hypothetical protein
MIYSISNSEVSVARSCNSFFMIDRVIKLGLNDGGAMWNVAIWLNRLVNSVRETQVDIPVLWVQDQGGDRAYSNIRRKVA